MVKTSFRFIANEVGPVTCRSVVAWLGWRAERSIERAPTFSVQPGH
jgi:hypothetical protein